MTVASVLARGRLAAESLMTDTCTIRRLTGYTTGATGVVTGGSSSTVYTGKCRIQVRALVGRHVDAVDQSVVMNPAELGLPVVGSEDVKVDDVATIDTSPGDPDMVGREWRIGELFHKSHATARRLGVRADS